MAIRKTVTQDSPFQLCTYSRLIKQFGGESLAHVVYFDQFYGENTVKPLFVVTPQTKYRCSITNFCTR